MTRPRLPSKGVLGTLQFLVDRLFGVGFVLAFAFAPSGCGSVNEGRHGDADSDVDTDVDTDVDSDADTDTGADAGPDAGRRCDFSTDCDDENACTEDRCESNTCVWIDENAPGVECDDGNDCTQNDLCIPNEGRCVGDSTCDDGNLCTHTDACTPEGTCVGTAYTCPAAGSAYSRDATCDGAGGCACPGGFGRLCVPGVDPSSGCYPQCCPGMADIPASCGPDLCDTSHCADDGVLICWDGAC